MPPGASTKYRPPTPAHSLVTRSRLFDTLRAGGHRRLIVIHGPAGFGKTTLAAQWREILVEEGVTVAWLTIDSDDNNLVWFLAHLIEAVRSVRPTLAEELRAALEAHGEEAGRYVLTSLINEIQEGHPHRRHRRRLAPDHRRGDHRGAGLPARPRRPPPAGGGDQSHASRIADGPDAGAR